MPFRVARVAGFRPRGGGALLRRRLRLVVRGRSHTGGRDRRGQRGEGRPRRPLDALHRVPGRRRGGGASRRRGRRRHHRTTRRRARHRPHRPDLDPEKSIFVAPRAGGTAGADPGRAPSGGASTAPTAAN